MLFRKNTVEIYESHQKQEFKKIQKRLKDAPDFTTYFIRVSEVDAEQARKILEMAENG